MKHVSSFIGAAICGSLAFGIWPEMWKSYGIMGGWLTATIVIGIAWYLNHWLGIIDNGPGRLWIDQGWGVAAAGAAWAVVRFDADVRQAVPVAVCCLLGGALGGVAAAAVRKTHPRFNTAAPQSEKNP
jgi:hypothetical protein